MCHNDYYIYKEMGRLITKKDMDYACEMVFCEHWWERLFVWIKYKFKRNY